MAYQAIGRGTSANDGTGDDLRTGAGKLNANFVEVYTYLGDGSSLSTDAVVTETATQTLTNKTITGTFTGNVTGNVTGDLTGDVTGNVTGDLTGDVTGNVTGDVTGDITGDVTGNLTGNVTGDVTGNLTGDVTGDLTGDVTGDLTGNVTGNVTGDVTGNADTATALATARTIAGVSFDGSANITIATTDLSDADQAVATTDDVSFNTVTLAGAAQLAVYADTTARDAAIASPSAGMVVFVTDGDGGGTAQFHGYDGSAWVSLN